MQTLMTNINSVRSGSLHFQIPKVFERFITRRDVKMAHIIAGKMGGKDRREIFWKEKVNIADHVESSGEARCLG